MGQYQYYCTHSSNRRTLKVMRYNRWAAVVCFLGVVAIYSVSNTRHKYGPHHAENAPEPERAIAIGSAAVITQDTGFWPCSPTQDALDEVIAKVVRQDREEVVRAMRKTRSIGLTSGMRVKILDTSFTQTKVRVTEPGDPRDERECWVVGDGVTK